MEDFCGGPFWDYELSWATTNPDVTFCFQQTALVYAPCALLWLLSPLEFYKARRSRYNDIPWGLLNISKSIVLVLLIALSFIDFSMARYHTDTQGLYPVHSVTPVIKIVTFTLAAALLFVNKKRGIRASGLLFTFWLLLFLFAILQLRSEIMAFNDRANFLDAMEWADYQFYSYMVYFGLLTVKLVLNCFVDAPPQFTSYVKPTKPTPEMSASFLRKLLFQWFDVMTWRGFRRPLELTDMWDVSPENTSRELNPAFDKYWAESVEKANRKKTKEPLKPKTTSQTTDGSILPAMVKAFGGPFWFAGLLRLMMDLLQFASPFLLRELIGFTGSDAAIWKGYLYTGALFGVFILMALLNGQYFERTSMVGFRIRAALINSIYRKAMIISNNTKKDTTVGEIVNLMAVDARNFFDLIPYLHYLWSGPLVIGLGLYFLYDILGPSVFAGIGTMVLLVPLTAVVTQQLTKLQTAQMKVKDERVKVMNEILNGIKVLKLYAWEPSFEASVLKKRSKEISLLKTAAIYDSVLNFVWTMSPFLVSLASFAVFVLVDSNNVLTPDVAFVSLTLFNILGFPLTLFSMMISFAIQCWVSVKRINKFLNSEELNPNSVTHKASKYAIEIGGDAVFTWGGEHTTLKSINLAVEKQALIAVVGKVGSGKSSLVSALLGEMEKVTGTVNTDGKVAYVAQQAWIQNASLQDNITFGREFDKEFYWQVVEACALKSDIEMLPGGDQTEIGEKGINLSGGQKQRVSLARAVYSRAEIFLLDDPLSAVDPHVGKHIFEQVIGPDGLLVGKTRFLVTHGVAFLPQMDEILVMLNGEISESGSYQSLLAQKGAFSEFLLEHMQKGGEDADVEVLKDIIGEPDIMELAEILPKKDTKMLEETNDRTEFLQKTSKLIEKEEAAVGSVGLSIYIRYFKNIGYWLAGMAFVFNAFVQAFAIYGNVWLSQWSEDPEAATDVSVRNLYLGVYGALGAGQALTMFAGSLVLAIGCLNAARNLHNKLLNSTLKFPMSFFDTTPLGRIMNRFSKEVEMVDNTLPMTIRVWILMVFNVLGVFVVITYSTPWFAVVIVPMFVLYYFIQRFYVATSRQLKRLESVTSSPIYSHFGESINGQSTIRAYGEEARFTNESQAKVDGNQMTSYPSIIANCWLSVRLELMGALVVLFASLFAVIGRENISPAIAGLSITYALQISQVLSFLVSLTAEVETNIVAIERIEEYAGMPQEAAWQKGEVDKQWPRDGIVVFDDFKLRYREGLELVLKGISFSVSGGEKIGIVGRTGAGKSSLTLALFRLIEAAGGKITIDGKNIADMGLHSLRLRLTIIPQDPVLFSGTLRMNIDPFDAYSDDDIWRVLEHSHLKVFVKGQSSGLLYEVAEGGENLSVGQRQLVCLARALLRKTKVLVLDEATAAVDLDTDDLIQKTIRSEFKECTVLTIAHRLNTILDSDRVLVLDKGEIAEFDSPDSLLQNPDSIFYSMAKDAGISGINSMEDSQGTKM